MAPPVRITDDLYWLGVNDRQTALFEALWPLPQGVAYNSYLITDERVALVDAVKDLFATDLVRRLRSILGSDRGLDYLIVNHLEPDHSGALRILPEIYPEVKIVGNRKTVEFLEQLHGLSTNLVAVEDGETLDLGRRKLRLIHAPMVHWPETMMTYDAADKILFSGDAFGGFGTVERGLFDDEVHDRSFYEEEALRYYSNIIGKFSPMAHKAIEKIRGLEISIVAPAHGIVWRHEPQRIVNLYDRWSRYEALPGVTLAYGSMYGNTEREMEALARVLAEEGVEDLRVHNVSNSHLSYLIRDVWRSRAVILGTPTYDVGVFPYMKHLIDLLEDKRLPDRLLGVFGSYGWSGGGVKGVLAFAERAGWEVVEPVVEARFAPSDDDLSSCREMARNLAARVRGG